MKKCSLRLTTAAAVVALVVGVGFSQPAHAQLGGLLGNSPLGAVLGGGGSSNPNDVMLAVANEMSKARDLMKKQSQLVAKGQQALAATTYVNNVVGALQYRQLLLQDQLLRGDEKLNENVTNFSKLMEKAKNELNKKKNQAVVSGQKASDKVIPVSDQKTIIVKETDGAKEANKKALDVAVLGQGDYQQMISAYSLSIGGAKANAKDLFFQNIYAPVKMSIEGAMGTAASTKTFLDTQLIPLFDRINAESEKETKDLLASSALTVGSLILRGKDLASAIDNLKKNPTNAPVVLNKMLAMANDLKELVEGIETSRSNVSKTQDALEETTALLKVLKAQLIEVEQRTGAMPAALDALVAHFSKA